MTNIQWRSWAVEQAIKLHGQHGITTGKVLAEAKALLDFVNEPEPAPEPPKAGDA